MQLCVWVSKCLSNECAAAWLAWDIVGHSKAQYLLPCKRGRLRKDLLLNHIITWMILMFSVLLVRPEFKHLYRSILLEIDIDCSCSLSFCCLLLSQQMNWLIDWLVDRVKSPSVHWCYRFVMGADTMAIKQNTTVGFSLQSFFITVGWHQQGYVAGKITIGYLKSQNSYSSWIDV